MTKILCIEDEKLIQESILEELTDSGYECFGAMDGTEGLQAIYDHQPDLVLCDVNMPKMNGFELLKELRENHPNLAGTPFIFLTADVRQENVISGLELGADDYLTKPIDFDLLMVKVSSSLRLRNEFKAQLDHEANFDNVTGLPNRVLALDRLLQELARGHREDIQVTAMSIGLLDLKNVVGTLGRDVGDHVLKEAAMRLRACVQDDETVAYLGGYEFLIIVQNQNFYSEEVARLVVNAFLHPLFLDEHEVRMNISIGLATYPVDADDPYTLLRHADMAMNQATVSGGGGFHYFSTSLTEEVENRVKIESFLLHALEREELTLNYQPLVDPKNDTIVGAEALLRWHNGELGFISPEVFIPIAETNGSIHAIGDWVLRTSCLQAEMWRKRSGEPFKIAVNMSVRQFSSADIVTTVSAALEESCLPAECLELEVTEGLLLGDSPLILSSLQKLNEMGVGLSMDDFGTGYSALSYLKKYPFDIIKIDRAFISGVIDDPSDAALVTAIIAMAHGLGLKVVAEGVEIGEQLAFVRALNCDFIQGYHYSKPLPADEFTTLLDTWS